MLTPEGALTADYQTFFAEYQEQLSQDFEGALLRRQLLSFRWLNSSLAARSLAEVMAERLLGPNVCRTEDPSLGSPTAVVERIAEISTRFWLASACDRQSLAAAAAKVVAQHQEEIVAFLEGDATLGAAR